MSAEGLDRELASARRGWDRDTVGTDWRTFLDRFHAERPGVTEEVLAHCCDLDQTPYEWTTESVAPGSVLDLACGSGPMRQLLHGWWIGFDRAPAELALAQARGGRSLVLGDAIELPFADASFEVVVCSMALMLVEPLDRALAEIARVLRADGQFVALLPTDGPLRVLDRLRYAQLLWVLRRRRLAYPNDAALRDIIRRFSAHQLTVTDDRRRRFGCEINTADVAVLCVRSLYLPGEEPKRVDAALRLAQRWIGETLGVPVRRVIAKRARGTTTSGPGAE